MEPCDFAESNGVLSKPEDMTHDQCSSLPVWRGMSQDNVPWVISCWKLTKEEVEELLKTGHLWVFIAGKTMPPLALTAKHPWSENHASAAA